MSKVKMSFNPAKTHKIVLTKKVNHDFISGMRKDLETMNYHGRNGTFTSKKRKKGKMGSKNAEKRSHFNRLSEESWLGAVSNKELRVL